VWAILSPANLLGQDGQDDLNRYLNEAAGRQSETELDRLQRNAMELMAQRATLEAQVKQLQKQLETLQQQQSKPAGLREDARVRVFKLKYAAPNEAAATIGQLTEGSAIRIAVDKSQNTLVVAADEKTLAMISEVLSTLDQPGGTSSALPENPTTTAVRTNRVSAKELAATMSQLTGNDKVEIAAVEDANVLIVRGRKESVQSVLDVLRNIERASTEPVGRFDEKLLLVRLVWVTNGSKWGVISPAKEYLDQRVIDSLGLIGVFNPSIMCQQVASVASGTTRAQVQFTSPAVLGGNDVLFNGSADVVLNPNGIVKLNLSAKATTTIHGAPMDAGKSFTGRIDGSIVTPLRTHVIMGTTNVVLFDKDNNTVSSYPAALVLYIDRLNQPLPGTSD
jgi:hypothetical protein